jgi:hypothetical protein
MSSDSKDELHAQQFKECYLLYEQEKYDECIASAKLNLSDPTLPIYFKIKTLVTLANAEEEWEDTEVLINPSLLNMHLLRNHLEV